jgi:predicted ribosome quality control (RQC) complex YloA/Tae2 family protein
MLENRIAKLENDIQQLRTELSIALEYYAEVREFLSELTQLTKKSTELEISKPTTMLSTTSSNIKPKSKIDNMLDKCINLIFQDYKRQSEGG